MERIEAFGSGEGEVWVGKKFRRWPGGGGGLLNLVAE